MKMLVTITVSGDVPVGVAFVDIVADVLEHHARDLRDTDSPAGNAARGFLEVTLNSETFVVDWAADYEPETAHNQEELGKMTPTTGRTVLYKLSERDAEQTNKRRADSKRHFEDNTGDAPGWIAHVGNTVQAGEIVPLVIVRVWGGDYVNGQAILDGNDSLWVGSAKEGHADGQWNWPVREIEEGR